MLRTLGDHLRHGGVGALAHVDGAAIERRRAVGGHVDDGDRGGRRDHRLVGDGEAAAALDVAGAALVERLGPLHPLEHLVHHLLDRMVLQDLAGGVRTSLDGEVLPAEFDRIHLQRPRHHVGVALIGPHQLRHAEAAQRARRRHVGVERVGVDPDVVDVVGAGRGQAGLLRHARADVGIGAAVPVHLALAGDDLAVLVDAALDAERRGVAGDLVEHLLEGVGDLHRLARDHRQRERQRLELDVELGAVARAEIRHLDPHLVFRPAEQAGDLGAHERRPLRGVVERDVGVACSRRCRRTARTTDAAPSGCGIRARTCARPRRRPCRNRRGAAGSRARGWCSWRS